LLVDELKKKKEIAGRGKGILAEAEKDFATLK